MRRRKLCMIAFVVAAALLLAACGGDSEGSSAPATTSPQTTMTAEGAQSDTTMAMDDGNAEVTNDEQTSEEHGGEEAAAGGDLSLVPAGETDLLGNPAGQGFVEINGARYDFLLNGACQRIFGAVQSSGPAADGSDAKVDAVIPPEDWETDTAAGWDPPYVAIEIGDDSWRAEANTQHIVGGESVQLSADQSSVTGFSNDGSRVAGDAVFFSEYNFDEVETVLGTFEFYCP